MIQTWSGELRDWWGGQIGACRKSTAQFETWEEVGESRTESGILLSGKYNSN